MDGAAEVDRCLAGEADDPPESPEPAPTRGPTRTPQVRGRGRCSTPIRPRDTRESVRPRTPRRRARRSGPQEPPATHGKEPGPARGPAQRTTARSPRDEGISTRGDRPRGRSRVSARLRLPERRAVSADRRTGASVRSQLEQRGTEHRAPIRRPGGRTSHRVARAEPRGDVLGSHEPGEGDEEDDERQHKAKTRAQQRKDGDHDEDCGRAHECGREPA